MSTGHEISSFVGQWKSKPEIVKCGPTVAKLQQSEKDDKQLSSSLPSLNGSTSSLNAVPSSPTQTTSGILSKLLANSSIPSFHRQRTSSLYLENTTLNLPKQAPDTEPLKRKRSISFTGNSADFYDWNLLLLIYLFTSGKEGPLCCYCYPRVSDKIYHYLGKKELENLYIFENALYLYDKKSVGMETLLLLGCVLNRVFSTKKGVLISLNVLFWIHFFVYSEHRMEYSFKSSRAKWNM